MKTPLRMSLSLTAVACAVLVGCGGSSDISISPSTPATTTVTVGTITGFGSVIVNGIRFNDSGATVMVNEQVATTAQLRVGMVVAVEGQVQACPNADVALCEGTAAQIRFRNNLVGPITTLNRLTNTLQVMGRDVDVDDSTAFDGVTGSDLSGLAVGDVVAVSGLPEQNRVRARLLQRIGPFVDGTTPLLLHGLVANVNTASGTCTVDGVQVRFQGLAAADLPAGGPANGQYVNVQGKRYGSGLMTADRIQLRDRISYPDASLVELEGFVSGFVSAANFIVDGQQVDASSAVFRNGTVADLKDGAKVEIEGKLTAGVLVATKVIFKLEVRAQVVAPIQSKDASTASLTVLGQGVLTTPLTQFIDKSTTGPGVARPVRTLAYADLAVNDRVDVRAYKDTTGKLIATYVERTEADTLLIAKGAVDAKTPVTKLTLLGIDVSTGAATRYRDALGNLITDIAFYNAVSVPPAVPTVVRAQGVASTASVSTIDATRTTSTRGEVEITH